MEDFKFIEKVSETPLNENTGLIFNGENIENKAENTYSAETIDKLVEEYSGVEEGTIVDWEDGVEVPEGWEIIETSIPTPDFSQRTAITLTTSTPYTVDEDAFFQIVGAIEQDTFSDVRMTADNQLLFYFWAKSTSTVTVPAVPLKKGTVVKLESAVNSSVNFFKMPPVKKKQIKKVATTRLSPITGSIVNGTNFVDKEHNTYSAEIIDTIIEENNIKIDEKNGIAKVTDISELLTMNTGFTLLDFTIYKDRKRYFGDITIYANTNGNFNGSNNVARLNKTIMGAVNSGCFLASNQWTANSVGYCFIAEQIVVADLNSTGFGVAKIHLDVVTTD